MNKKSIKIILLGLFSLLLIAVIYYSNTLLSINNKGRTRYLKGTYFSLNSRPITIDSKGQPWIIEAGYNDHPIVKVLEGESWIAYTANDYWIDCPTSSNFKGWHLSSLIGDKTGNIWISTSRCGIVKFDGKNWTSFTAQNSDLASNEVQNLFVDNQNRIWITYTSYPQPSPGITIFDGVDWTTFDTENSGLPATAVYAIAFDSENRSWIGTDVGLTVFDGEKWITYTSDNSGLPSAAVYDIAFDKEDRAWIGLAGQKQGVSMFDGEHWIYYSPEEMGFYWDFDRNYHNQILIDQLGRVWVWDDKVRILDKGDWIDIDNVLGSDISVYSMEMDRQGNIWILDEGKDFTSNKGSLIVLDSDYSLDSLSHASSIKSFRIAAFTLVCLIIATLLGMKILRKIFRYGILILVFLFPTIALAYGGMLIGISVGINYTDFPLIETIIGTSVFAVFGMLIGALAAFYLWKKLFPRILDGKQGS